ncbi:MAG: hypothetical protein E6G67_07990 [Actinobacteria bacterium]|nr:MAG: hypothetical protein E6G67_07990 [Actinomycetota bacterium]
MSDYLTSLAARALGVADVVRPSRSLFEPRRGARDPAAEAELDAESPRAPATQPTSKPPVQRVDAASEPHEAPTVGGEKARPEPVSPAPVALRPHAVDAASGPERRATRASPPSRERSSRRFDVAARVAPGRVPAKPDEVETPEVLEVAAEVAATPRPDRPAKPGPWPPARETSPRPAAPAEPAQPPIVRVTIGRVDVRAVAPEKSPERERSPKPSPTVSLDEYLGRSGSGR